jgi:hypothetical protein
VRPDHPRKTVRPRHPAARLAGVRTAWRTVGDGEFFCPDCGGDRGYRRRTGRRRLVVLGVPVLPRGDAPPVVECGACRAHFGTSALGRPTTRRLEVMLRGAVEAVILSVLTADGCASRAALSAAAAGMRDAGHPACTEEDLLVLLATGEAGGEPCRAGLREVLEPLSPHLALPGRENVLLRGAAVALADGPYRPGEREVLDTVGRALALRPADTERLLAAARTPS